MSLCLSILIPGIRIDVGVGEWAGERTMSKIGAGTRDAQSSSYGSAHSPQRSWRSNTRQRCPLRPWVDSERLL